MSHTEQVAELLLRWEELGEQGQHVSAEELCRECPGLLDEVRAKLRALQAVYRVPNQLDETAVPGAERTAAGAALPRVPGYEILGELGSGGMGKVYKARDLALNRLVALKMILSGVHARSGELARFKVEAEALARLHHPNIVQIYEVGECDGIPFLALEYVAGGSLDRHLQGKPLPPRQAAELVRTLADAVQHAHKHGVVHRDLKLSNILLADGGTLEPRISDFGLAKKLDELGQTQTGAVLGSPSYMAPEQAEGRIRDIGPVTDVYALGAILYELLTGRPPFAAATMMETLEQVRVQEPEPPRRLVPQVPRELEAICLCCLEKEPARRYPSAQVLAEDLERFLNGELVEARGSGVVGQLSRVLNRMQPIVRVQGRVRYLFWAALPLPFGANLVLYLIAGARPYYGPLALAVWLAAIVALLLLAYRLQQMRAFVSNPGVNRQLWSLRFGALLGMSTLTALSYALTPPGQPWDALAVFPQWAALAGVLFFVMGGLFWGRLYLVGLCGFLVALTMPLYLPLAPVALGLLVSGSLLLIVTKTELLRREEGQR
jgi:serine/threonine-protein kinase